MAAEQIAFVTYCIGNLSQRLGLSQTEVYNSDTFGLIQDGVAGLHCRSDEYLAGEILGEKHSSA